MTVKATKAARIMALHKQRKTTREIAMAVYQLPKDAPWEVVDRKAAYVRVVIGQRQGVSYSAAETRYLLKKYGGKTVQEASATRERIRYATNPSRRAYLSTYSKNYRKPIASIVESG